MKQYTRYSLLATLLNLIRTKLWFSIIHWIILPKLQAASPCWHLENTGIQTQVAALAPVCLHVFSGNKIMHAVEKNILFYILIPNFLNFHLWALVAISSKGERSDTNISSRQQALAEGLLAKMIVTVRRHQYWVQQVQVSAKDWDCLLNPSFWQ